MPFSPPTIANAGKLLQERRNILRNYSVHSLRGVQNVGPNEIGAFVDFCTVKRRVFSGTHAFAVGCVWTQKIGRILYQSIEKVVCRENLQYMIFIGHRQAFCKEMYEK